MRMGDTWTAENGGLKKWWERESHGGINSVSGSSDEGIKWGGVIEGGCINLKRVYLSLFVYVYVYVGFSAHLMFIDFF